MCVFYLDLSLRLRELHVHQQTFKHLGVAWLQQPATWSGVEEKKQMMLITAFNLLLLSLSLKSSVWVRYEKTGTPLNKELRQYVEEMKKEKAKAAAKVEPEQVG